MVEPPDVVTLGVEVSNENDPCTYIYGEREKEQNDGVLLDELHHARFARSVARRSRLATASLSRTATFAPLDAPAV